MAFPFGFRRNMLRFLQQLSVIFSGPCRFNVLLNNLEIKQVSSPIDHSPLVPLPSFLSMQMALLLSNQCGQSYVKWVSGGVFDLGEL